LGDEDENAHDALHRPGKKFHRKKTKTGITKIFPVFKL